MKGAGRLLLIGLSCGTKLFAVEPLAPRADPRAKAASHQSDYALVGVISEGAAGQRGVAVLKDLHTDRSVTLSVGDQVPGRAMLSLKSVSRNSAVLEGNGQTYFVTTTAGTYSDQKATKPESRDAEPDNEMPGKDRGLLERWFSERSGVIFGPTPDRSSASHNEEAAIPGEEFPGDMYTDEDEDDGVESGDDSGELYRPYSERPLSQPVELAPKVVDGVLIRTYDDPELQALIEDGLKRQPK